jgi:aerobic-type carbon monoxide dehydrogenase small subunit (CoxS/CutS family)
MIMELSGLLKRKPIPSDDELLAKMEGHICRCCTYASIIKAIRRAAAEARK